MICLGLTADTADDATFIALVGELMTGAIAVHRPNEVYVFKIDRWFDHKWLGFSGKFLGALGFWAKQLTIPPFVPNRIVDQAHFVRDHAALDYRKTVCGAMVHHHGRSEDNLRRSVKRIAPEAALFWYCGDTATTGRGSLMGYNPVENDHWTWFIAFERTADWRVARRKGIHDYEVRMFQEAAQEAKIA